MKGTLTKKKVAVKPLVVKKTVSPKPLKKNGAASTVAPSKVQKKNGVVAPVPTVIAQKPVVIKTKVKSILITQPKPESDKNPYQELVRKYKVEVGFKPFINLEVISATEFRKFKINLHDFRAVVFTSRNAIDQFFKLSVDLRVTMSQDTKYFCMSEAIALYLQKYILYRKRKVFFGNGTLKGLTDQIMKHRDGDRYVIPCADSHKSDIAEFLAKHKLEYREAPIFRTTPVVLNPKEILKYDMIAFFAPAGVHTLLHNIPNFKQGNMRIGAFGPLTTKAVEDAGLRLDIKAPVEGAPSMAIAIEQYLSKQPK